MWCQTHNRDDLHPPKALHSKRTQHNFRNESPSLIGIRSPACSSMTQLNTKKDQFNTKNDVASVLVNSLPGLF